jgi:hypothetical protein
MTEREPSEAGENDYKQRKQDLFNERHAPPAKLLQCNVIKRRKNRIPSRPSLAFFQPFDTAFAPFLSYMIAGRLTPHQIAMRLFIWAEESATLRAETL